MKDCTQWYYKLSSQLITTMIPIKSSYIQLNTVQRPDDLVFKLINLFFENIILNLVPATCFRNVGTSNETLGKLCNAKKNTGLETGSLVTTGNIMID